MPRKKLTANFLLILVGSFSSAAYAQAPTATGRCVYNCDAPQRPMPSSSGGAGSGISPVLEGAATAAGARIGGWLFGGEERIPDRGQTEAARQSLDQWANEEPKPTKRMGGMYR
jgi:hypothetical protein